MATCISVEIVERIASQIGVDPLSLDVPLQDSIDVDSLNTLTNETHNAKSGGPLHIEFTYYDYPITVTATGDVTIGSKPSQVESDTAPVKKPIDD